MRKCVFWAILVIFFFAGCGGSKEELALSDLGEDVFWETPWLPEASGGFTLAVGGETITSDEISAPLMKHLGPIAEKSDFEQFEVQARPIVAQVVTNQIANVLLLRQAKKKLGDNVDEILDKAADTEVRRFITRFQGDVAKAEQALEEMGMDWADFKDYQKKMILSQSYVQKQISDEKPVTHQELRSYYNAMRDEFFATKSLLTFRLIDIEIDKVTPTDPNKSAELHAMVLARELVQRIQAGDDFGELAQKHSHGHRSQYGGLWKPVEPQSLAEPYDRLAAEAEKIEPGQIAGPIEVDGHIFIMKLEGKQAGHVEPFEQVQGEVEAKILLDRRRRAIDELSGKLAQEAAVANMGSFVDFCVREIYQKGSK